MRNETKIGIIIGIIIAAAGVVYFAAKDSGKPADIPDTAIFEDTVPVKTNPVPEKKELVTDTPAEETKSSTEIAPVTPVVSVPEEEPAPAAAVEEESNIASIEQPQIQPQDDDQQFDDFSSDISTEGTKLTPATPAKQEVTNTKAADKTPVTAKKTSETEKAAVSEKTKTANDPLANLPAKYQDQINEPRYHIVSKGDSLYSISTEYFGTGKYWEAIYKVNKSVITNASSLRIGWRLRIPSPEEIEK